MHKIAIVGGGTAGIIAASLLKTYYQDKVQVVLIYDHSKPSIGVGESLTPIFVNYLNIIGVTQKEIIKNVNATIKIGLKFKNWLNDNKHFYHGFYQFGQDDSGLGAAYDISHNRYDLFNLYSKEYFENNVIPDLNKCNKSSSYSYHLDATSLSRYLELKFKDHLTIIDDVVVSVVKDKNNLDIKSLVLSKNKKITADFFIDASGFNRVLIKHMNTKWVDMTDWLPIDRFIPNPVPTKHKIIPPYTTAEATDNGWILQLPLQNRWSTGYMYSSRFTSDKDAFKKFNQWTKKTFNTKLHNNGNILKFESGYWEKQWVGNCITVGLSSGFAEPLEATNIHHVISQMLLFLNMYNFKTDNYTRALYNEKQNLFYNNIYLYIRFCYTGKRFNSKFWKYISNNTPDIIKDLEKKVQNSYLNVNFFPPGMFNHVNFTCVANGLNKCNSTSIKEELFSRNKLAEARRISDTNITQKQAEKSLVIDNKVFIEQILNSI
jgi:tryptophan halogenase